MNTQLALTRQLKKFRSGYKNVNDQEKLDRPKKLNFVAVPLEQIRIVTLELSISQSSVVCYLHGLGKSQRSSRIVSLDTKILKDFWLILIYKLAVDDHKLWQLIFNLVFRYVYAYYME